MLLDGDIVAEAKFLLLRPVEAISAMSDMLDDAPMILESFLVI